MPPLPLDIPPGFVKVDSPNGAQGRYTGGNKVRFVKLRPEKWKGWRKFIEEQVVGRARGAVSWTNVFSSVNVSIGTHLKLFAITGGDTLHDITPIRATSTINNNPFSVEEDSDIVTVTDTAHGQEVDGFVIFSGATAAGGITIDGEYQILDKLDTDSYTIQHSSPATSTAVGGGNAVEASYLINPGPTSTVGGLGWGAGPYGEGTWGTPRTEGIPTEIRHWSVHEYGNDLLASPSGDTLFLWQEATDERAEAVANAPVSIRAMFITGERYVIALGTVTPMTVQWPDRDDITDWIPGLGDTANQRVLQSGSKLVAGTAVADAVSLVWSDTSVYVFQYTGNDLIYDSRLIGTNCGLIGPLAFAKVSSSVFWRSGKTFYAYSGGGAMAIPNVEDIEDYVNADMDPEQAAKCWAEYDEPNKQVRWHYVSLASLNGEPDKYVDVTIGDWTWTTGEWDDHPRLTGTKYAATAETNLLVDDEGTIWEHNVGTDADGEPMHSYLDFGLYAIASGAQNVDVFGIIPDCQRQSGPLVWEVKTKERPNSAGWKDTETTTLEEGDEIADIRVCGRHFTARVTSNVEGGDFRLGIVNLEVQPSGERR
jgi:hypothetical protein